MLFALTGGGCRWLASYGSASKVVDARVDAPADAAVDLLPELGPDSSDLIGPPPDMRSPLCAFEAVPPLDGNGIDRVWVSPLGRVFVARGRAVFERDENAGWTQVVGSTAVAGDGVMVALRGNESHLYALHNSGVLWRILLKTKLVDISSIDPTVQPTNLTVLPGEIFLASASTVYAVQWQTPASVLVPLGSTPKDFPNTLKTLWHDGKHLWTAGSSGLFAYFDDEEPRWNKETAVAATWTAGWGQNPGLRVEVVVGMGGKGRRLNGTSAVVTDVDAKRDALAIWGRSRFDVYAGGRAGLLKVLGAEGGWEPVPVSDGSVPSSDEVVDLWGNNDTLVAGITRDPGGTNQALILRCQLR